MHLYVLKDSQDKINIKFSYDKIIIKKIKSISGSRWHPEKRVWTIPNSNLTLKRFLQMFQKKHLKFSSLQLMAGRKEVFKYFNDYYVERLNKILKLRGYSVKTRKSYNNHLKRFIDYIEKDPVKITKEDINRYILYLLDIKNNSHSFVNQFISSIKIFTKELLDWKETNLEIYRPKNKRRLPKVLSKNEVTRLINSLDNLKHKTILTLTYSSGLRVSEIAKLKVSDLDRRRMLLYVRSAKGNKDRYTLLSEKALETIDLYLKAYNIKNYENDWLFPGQDKSKHLTTRSIQRVFKKACKKANIKKDVSIHTLRHSFATHLLEQGIDIRYIQELLGHKSSKTTEIYTHVTNKEISKIKNPLDQE